MFLTREHFRSAEKSARFISKNNKAKPLEQLALGFAKDIFDDEFEQMSKSEKEAVLQMLIKDMKLELLLLQ